MGYSWIWRLGREIKYLLRVEGFCGEVWLSAGIRFSVVMDVSFSGDVGIGLERSWVELVVLHTILITVTM